MGRPYYSRIAKQWHKATGYQGGPLKKYVLNDYLLKNIESITDCSILELGAGNGYFIPLMLKRFSGQIPARIVITDLSGALLSVAQKEFRVKEAEYTQLDIRNRFPFEAASFDLILSTMVFNEVSTLSLKFALNECSRVLQENGRLLVTITHPEFIASLSKNGKLSKLGPEFWTMPGKGALRVPVVVRSEETYIELFKQAGFYFTSESLYPSSKVFNERPGLRNAGNIPLALVFICTKMI
ncbi:MAG: class I SAM-dependent methyltransferase [Deltaproteobacteria bacterium]|nr:MAG: class I SAM-dependent methyltransferase [Deltaproteobacteria bacterium]